MKSVYGHIYTILCGFKIGWVFFYTQKPVLLSDRLDCLGVTFEAYCIFR